MTSLQNAFLLAVMTTAACSNSTEPVEPEREYADPGPLCDESGELRFGYDVRGGRITGTRYVPFLMHNGWEYLGVRGDCSYLVDWPNNGELRTGQLSQDEAEALAKKVDYASIERWQDL